MTQELIIGNNRLIAVFMGVEINDAKDKCNHPLITAPWPPIECLKYHSSWDWLMPVVEKIESLGYEVTISGGSCTIGDIDPRFTKYRESKILAVYSAVLEFIRWYNINNS